MRHDYTAAYKFYCGKYHTNAHGAEADTLASAEVFNNAQIEKYALEPSFDSLNIFIDFRFVYIYIITYTKINLKYDIEFNFS